MNTSHKQVGFANRLKAQHPTAWKTCVQDGELSREMSEASKQIDVILAYIGGFRPNTIRAIVAESLRDNKMSKVRTFRALKDRVGQAPLVFSANSGNGYRIPMSMSKQREALHRTIDEVYESLRGGAIPDVPMGSDSPEGGAESEPSPMNPYDTDAPDGEGEGDGGADGEGESDGDGDTEGDEDGEGDEDAEGEAESDQTPEQQQEEAQLLFLDWIQSKVRPFCKSQNADGASFDTPGMRAAENGAKLLALGIPVEACKDAMTMHYPAEARRHLGVEDFDTLSFSPELQREGMHKALPYCLTVINAGVPLALIGTHGTGKTTLAKQIAGVLKLPFAGTSMTSGTSPSAFNGRVNPFNDEKTLSQFLRVFCKKAGNGGVYLFDEMDAADENLFLKVNMALANGIFFNDATGEEHEMHDHFVAIAGMNTMGMGADRDYVGRVKLDAAALDRWAMGRVKLELDEDLERFVFEDRLTGTSPRFDLASL